MAFPPGSCKWLVDVGRYKNGEQVQKKANERGSPNMGSAFSPA